MFLQDLAKGHIYFKFQHQSDKIILSLINEGNSYLSDIIYNATAQDINNNVYTKNGKIEVFKKGDIINIIIPLKIPNVIIIKVELSLTATINGLYRFTFQVKRE
jgi:hypothetical protein